MDSAVRVIRTKGYAATRVEDVCADAGLTKGSFFHHFSSKEDLVLSAIEHFDADAEAMFQRASYRSLSDPLARLLAYVELRKDLLRAALSEFTCFFGTIVQEVYATHPAIRKACERCMTGHASTLEPDIAEAIRKYGISTNWTPNSLALYTQAVLQGAFILAKAREGPEAAVACLDHLSRYLEMLFIPAEVKDKTC